MNIVSDLFQRKPDVIGFSCYIWNIEETIKVIDIVKKIMPEVTIILGGPEVSYDTEYWMKRRTMSTLSSWVKARDLPPFSND